MAYVISPERLTEYKAFLREHPIDHAYDEEMGYLDGKVPMSELAARTIYSLLQDLGELDEDLVDPLMPKREKKP